MGSQAPARVVVLASGSGTNAQALMAAAAAGELGAQIVAVVTNNPDAGVIERAGRFDVPAVVVDHHGSDPAKRVEADRRLIQVIGDFAPDLVVMAGWMRILGAEVGAKFRIINLHPALPGAFAGTNAIGRAFAAWRAGEITESGVMIHQVPDAAVDAGPVIVSESVGFLAEDTLETFEARIRETEHRLIVAGTRIALGRTKAQTDEVRPEI